MTNANHAKAQGVEATIATRLSAGTPALQLVREGFKKSTVYKVAGAGDPELAGLRAIIGALNQLDFGAQQRVLAYLNARYSGNEV